jgi:tRNA(Ile)-lysidine synthase
MKHIVQIDSFIKKHRLVRSGQKILVGVSGGPDSLALLDCLHQLGFDLVLAHLDHSLRLDSSDDAEFVQKIAREYDYKIIIERENVAELARNERSSIEETARLARYRFFYRLALREGISAVAVGHTADDQIETILMNFLRGAGARGLRGIQPNVSLGGIINQSSNSSIRLIRPLLELFRNQTEEHCLEMGLNAREDSSNRDFTYLRNRVRYELLPYLEEFNLEVGSAILKTAEILSDDYDWLEQSVRTAFDEIMLGRSENAFLFNVDHFLGLHVAQQRGLIRKMAQNLLVDWRDFDFDAVSRARSVLGTNSNRTRISLPGNLELLRYASSAVLRIASAKIPFTPFPQMINSDPIRLIVPGMIALASGWMLQTTFQDLSGAPDLFVDTSNMHNRVLVNQKVFENPIYLRCSRPGDRIQPFGMQGTTRLTKVLTDLHVIREARQYWPVLAGDEKVFWLAGLRLSEFCRVGESDDRGVLMVLEKPEKSADATTL